MSGCAMPARRRTQGVRGAAVLDAHGVRRRPIIQLGQVVADRLVDLLGDVAGADLAVPMAQAATTSSSSTTSFMAAADTPARSLASCSLQTSAHNPASYSSSVSPIHNTGRMPSSMTLSTFLLMASSSSLKTVRRSEWPHKHVLAAQRRDHRRAHRARVRAGLGRVEDALRADADADARQVVHHRLEMKGNGGKQRPPCSPRPSADAHVSAPNSDATPFARPSAS